MTAKKQNIQLQQGAGNTKNLQANANSLAAQRQKLLGWLRSKGRISTLTARRDLDILAPAARIFELRHRFGQSIDLVWVRESTDCGKLHRVGLYVLKRSRKG